MTEQLEKYYNILIVEDDDDDFELLSEVLNQLHRKVIIRRAKDGDETLDCLSLNNLSSQKKLVSPDLIILDLNMPKRHGSEILQIIKNDKKLRKTPVIVFTTSSDDAEVQKCYLLGANSYIIKPMNYDNYLEAIKSLEEYWLDNVKLPE